MPGMTTAPTCWRCGETDRCCAFAAFRQATPGDHDSERVYTGWRCERCVDKSLMWFIEEHTSAAEHPGAVVAAYRDPRFVN